MKNFSIICFLFVITQIPKLIYNKNVGKSDTPQKFTEGEGCGFIDDSILFMFKLHSFNHIKEEAEGPTLLK